jgi:hypothetical protein
LFQVPDNIIMILKAIYLKIHLGGNFIIFKI